MCNRCEQSRILLEVRFLGADQNDRGLLEEGISVLGVRITRVRLKHDRTEQLKWACHLFIYKQYKGSDE